jgi:ferredoxin-NADP reductase
VLLQFTMMKLHFIAKKREAGNAVSFAFQPAEPASWIAGQSIRLEINGHERRFSIASAPFEQAITIITRLSDSDFKQALDKLEPGAEIDGFNIEGTFVWENSPPQKVILASGIGITPYISMLRQLHHDKQTINALLIYANRDDQFICGDTLRHLSQTHALLNVVYLPGKRLSRSVIETYIASPARNLVYVSGPEAMVAEISLLLLDAGVNETLLKKDIFTGRAGWDG